jgi:hypothetical protein
MADAKLHPSNGTLHRGNHGQLVKIMSAKNYKLKYTGATSLRTEIHESNKNNIC